MADLVRQHGAEVEAPGAGRVLGRPGQPGLKQIVARVSGATPPAPGPCQTLAKAIPSGRALGADQDVGRLARPRRPERRSASRLHIAKAAAATLASRAGSLRHAGASSAIGASSPQLIASGNDRSAVAKP